jgi:hypothetical protein
MDEEFLIIGPIMESSLLQTITHKLETLPAELQQEVLDYIEFLLQKYQIEANESGINGQTDQAEQQPASVQPQKLEFW